MSWKQRLMAKFGITEPYNIEFRITGKSDGKWNIRAYDSGGVPIGRVLVARTPDEAWKIWMFLNGYSNEVIETQELVA